MPSIDETIASSKIVVFSKTYCPFCTRAKNALSQAGVGDMAVVELDERDDGSELQGQIKSKYNHHTVPAVFINGELLGGCDDTLAAIKSGKLKGMLDA